MNLFISLDPLHSQNQSKITDNPYMISFHFVPIPYGVCDKYNCCNTQCNAIPRYYLKSSKNNIIGRFCNSCKEVQERHGSDSLIIQPPTHKKSK